LLTAGDTKLERLKFATIFTVADMLRVKKQAKCILQLITGLKKLGTEITFTLDEPFTRLKSTAPTF